MNTTKTDITKSKIWIYGSIGLPIAMIGYPLGIWIPRLYSTEIGLSLSVIGLIIFSAAIFDAITDPIMGFVSDKMKTRWGRRKPWIAIGAPIFAFTFWMLLNPGPEASLLYLAFFYIFLRVGSTMVALPHAAWGAELSSQYHTRTIIQSAREKYILMGLMSAAGIVLLSEIAQAPERPKASYVLANFGWLVLLILPITTLLVLWKVPEPTPSANQNNLSLFQSLRNIWRNRLFRRLILIELLVSGGEAFRNSLSLFFIQDYIGAERVGWLYIVYFTVGLAAIPVWDRIAQTYGKHRSLATAMVLVGLISIGCFMLSRGDVIEFYVLFALKGFCFGAFAYLPRAMLAWVDFHVRLVSTKEHPSRNLTLFAHVCFEAWILEIPPFARPGKREATILEIVNSRRQGAVNFR